MEKSNSSENLTNQAYNTIKQGIISGKYQHDEIINMTAIAKELGISRTPITYAFKKLESEGVVKIIPKLGVMVKSPSFKDVKNLYDARLAVELYAANRAFDLLTEKDIDLLNKSLEKQKLLVNQINIFELWDEDMRFHSIIIKKSGNDIIYNIFESLFEKLFTYKDIAKFNSSTIMQHEMITNSIRDKDKEGFIENYINHITKAFQLDAPH